MFNFNRALYPLPTCKYLDHVTSDLCKRGISIFLFFPFIDFILRQSLCILHWPQTLPPPETHDAQLTGY